MSSMEYFFFTFVKGFGNNSHFENERWPYVFIGNPMILFLIKNVCYNDNKTSYNFVFNHTRTARL